MDSEKFYEGTVYTGVVGPPTIPVQSVLSIFNMTRREGDALPNLRYGTKGYEVRQAHVDAFMESSYDFLLLLDHDMIFAPDTLERLRSHGKAFVSGYYLRRQFAPMYSVWYEDFDTDDDWPMSNYLDEPPQDKLVPIGASGWGCILVHRDVIQDTRDKILQGENDVIEDDMDVWPYDLGAVMRGEERLRPLRVNKKSVVGSDIRYPFYAKAAGHQLWGDASVRPKHIIDYPLSPDDFSGQSVANIAELERIRDTARAEQRDLIVGLREDLQVRDEVCQFGDDCPICGGKS